MQFQLQATNLDLTSSIKAYVEKRLGELDKFVPEGTLVRADIELERTTNHHRKGDVFRAEANIELPGHLVYAESAQDDLYAAIDKLKDEVRRGLVSYKEKLTDKRRQGGREAKEELREADVAE